MPLYEYVCQDCKTRFDALRSIADADKTIQCKKCSGTNTTRQLSVFYAHSSGHAVAGTTSGGCAGCSGGSCSSCSH